MAQIQWNPNFRTISLILNPIQPQVIHPIPYSNKKVIFNTGQGYWTGVVTFGLVSNRLFSRSIEADLTAMLDPNNYMNLRLDHIKATGTTNHTITGVHNDHVDLTTQRLLYYGAYYVSNKRLYQAVSSDAGVNFFPNNVLKVGDVLTTTPLEMRIRSVGGTALTQTPDGYGPWSIQFEEYIE